MSIFVISDLHLSLGADKPMDVFGPGWEDYVARIEAGWRRNVTASDTVVIGGDISWAINDRQLLPDLQFLDGLPGRKVLLQGNHDYWWQTVSRMRRFLEREGLSFEFLYNNALECEGVALCGAKGYLSDKEEDAAQNEKLHKRALLRLEYSLAQAEQQYPGLEKLVFLHYPPVLTTFENEGMLACMRRYGVKRCYYGHLHAAGHAARVEGTYHGIDFTLTAADFVDFTPVFIK